MYNPYCTGLVHNMAYESMFIFVYATLRLSYIVTTIHRTTYSVIHPGHNSILVRYSLKLSANGETPLPSTFTINDYTRAGKDNSVHDDKSSPSGMMGSHYAAL